MKNKLILIAAVALTFGIGFWATKPETTPLQIAAALDQDTALVEIIIPASLSENGKIGRRVYNNVCATCHAPNAVGQAGVAPPLIHKIYEPSHHGDESFQRAVALGVRAHHWPFGNMPPIDGLSRADVKYIIHYLREIQRENGIN